MKAGNIFFLFCILYACNSSPNPTAKESSINRGDAGIDSNGGSANNGGAHSTGGAATSPSNNTTLGGSSPSSTTSGGTQSSGGSSTATSSIVSNEAVDGGTNTSYGWPYVDGLPPPPPSGETHQCCLHDGIFGLDYGADCTCEFYPGPASDGCPADYPQPTCQGQGECLTTEGIEYISCCEVVLFAQPWPPDYVSWGIQPTECDCSMSVVTACPASGKIDTSWIYSLPSNYDDAFSQIPSDWVNGKIEVVGGCGQTPMGPPVGGMTCPWLFL